MTDGTTINREIPEEILNNLTPFNRLNFEILKLMKELQKKIEEEGLWDQFEEERNFYYSLSEEIGKRYLDLIQGREIIRKGEDRYTTPIPEKYLYLYFRMDIEDELERQRIEREREEG